MHTGVDITLDDIIVLVEGEIQQVCVMVNERSHERERDIHISFTVTPNSYGASKNYSIIVDHYFVNHASNC